MPHGQSVKIDNIFVIVVKRVRGVKVIQRHECKEGQTLEAALHMEPHWGAVLQGEETRAST